MAWTAAPARGDPKFNLDGDKIAGDKVAGDKATGEKSAGAKTGSADSAAKKDPVEMAFALPKGTVLRPDQQKAFDKMKKELEPKLKDALSNVEKATVEQEKTKAAHEALHIRQDIKAQIKNILALPDPTVKQPQQPKRRRNRWGYYNNSN